MLKEKEIIECIRRADNAGLFLLPPREPNRGLMYLCIALTVLAAAGILSAATASRMWVFNHCNGHVQQCQ